MCGGTGGIGRGRELASGLSPRVRGNRPSLSHTRRGRRSIPACAGEPVRANSPIFADGVYPRVCGGTRLLTEPVTSVMGLSPRVRGNQGLYGPCAPRLRSIPACAGEPGWRARPCRTPQVYPRVCGGTLNSSLLVLLEPGLSPRVRGNHADQSHAGEHRRSIPACAGEPR